MTRNHVHFAVHEPGHRELISGMRSRAEVLIYLDVPKALDAGMNLWRSSNNVLLTRGLDGVIPIDYFSKVVRAAPRQMIGTNRELLPDEVKEECTLQLDETVFSISQPHPNYFEYYNARGMGGGQR